MNNTIEDFYVSANTPQILIKKKKEKFDRNPDIAAEFETWIQEKEYRDVGAVVVEGYTAKNLADLSEYLKGEGAYMMLIELRENPEKALEKIKNGFKWK